MDLNPSTPAPAPVPRRAVSIPVLAVALLVAAGLSIAGTAVVFELHPFSPPSKGPRVTVTDDLGRQVSVPASPSRVVALGPNAMDILVRLGLRAHVVGVDCSNASLGGLMGDYTPNQTAAWNLTSAMCVVAYPQLSVEDVLNRSPALILASSVISVPALEGIQSTYGIPVVILNPSTLGGIVYDVETVAQIFQVSAASLVAQLQTALAGATQFLTNLTNNGTPLRTVLASYYVVPAGAPSAGYFTFGAGSFGQSLLELSGGVNIASNSTEVSPELTGGQVLYANPGLVLCGVGFGIGLSQFAQGPDWSSLPAVQHGNVTTVDVTLMTEADPTMVLSLHLFRHLLYPNLVPA